MTSSSTVTPMGVNEAGNRVPVPDPTKLTTDALDKALEKVTVDTQRAFDAATELSAVKVDNVAQRFELLEASIEGRLHSLQELLDEKFSAVGQRFDLQEQQRIEQKQDTKAAVDAALIAQKEAVKEQTTASSIATQKSETATNKSLEQQAAAAATEATALRRQIDELKERIAETDRNARQSTADLDRSLRQSISEVASTANAYGQQKQGGADTKTSIAWGLSAVLAIIVIVTTILAVIPHG